MRTSLREMAMSKPIACSETSMELHPAALQTFMPYSSAAARSVRSTPTPVRQTTLVFLSCEMTSLVKGTAPCMMIASASTHFNHLGIVGGPRDHQLGIDLIKDRFDEIDGNIVAAEIFDPKF